MKTQPHVSSQYFILIRESIIMYQILTNLIIKLFYSV